MIRDHSMHLGTKQQLYVVADTRQRCLHRSLPQQLMKTTVTH